MLKMAIKQDMSCGNNSVTKICYYNVFADINLFSMA